MSAYEIKASPSSSLILSLKTLANIYLISCTPSKITWLLSPHLCEPASHGGLGRGLHRDRAAGLDFEYVLQNPDPLLQDVGWIGGQIEGLLLCNQLIRRKGEKYGKNAEPSGLR